MSWYYGPDEAYAVQRLAREQMVHKLLGDLLVDMRICQLRDETSWSSQRG